MILSLLKRLFHSQDESVAAFDPACWETLSLPFPYVLCQGEEALARRAELDDATHSAVIVGDDDDARGLQENSASSEDSVETILAAAAALDVDAWVASELAESQEDEEGHDVLPFDAWPKQPLVVRIGSHLKGFTGRSKPWVAIGVIPSPRAWELPAFVGYSGHACLTPEVHVAMHARWAQRYGSRIVCMSGDVIECVVSRPPRVPEEALALAYEHIAYCPDLAEMGLERLAASLMKSEAWYFWWD